MSNKNDDWVTEWWWFLVGVVPIIAIISTLSKCTDLTCMLSSFILPAGYGIYRAMAAGIRCHRANAPQREAARARHRQEAADLACRRAEEKLQQEQRDTEKKRIHDEKERQMQAESSVKEARMKAEGFYHDHRDLLQDVFPPSLFQASLKTEIPENCTPEHAWAAARALIAQIVKLVSECKQHVAQVETEKARAEVVGRPGINPEDV